MKNPAPRTRFARRRTALAVLTLLGGMAHAGTITRVTPSTGRLDVGYSKFVVEGTGLKRADISIQDCAPDKAANGDRDKASVVDYRCTPVLPGKKTVSLAGVLQQPTVKIDHPTRMGDVAARGVPAVLGVSTFNGNYFHQVTDMVVPGRGPAFTVSRSYNSYYSALEGTRRGAVDNYRPWRTNWELHIGYATAPGQGKQQVFVQRPDGTGANFWLDPDSASWVPIDQGSFERLVFDAPKTGQVTLFSRDGLRYIFEAPVRGNADAGRLLKVSDHDGNALKVTYGANLKPAMVEDASGRQFTFTYNASQLLERVTDHTGRYVQYAWDTDTAPDGSPRARISAVRDVRGKVTDYFYSHLNSGDGLRPRVFLTRIALQGGGPVTDIAYNDQVYSDWGVLSVTRKVDDALSLTTQFAFCPEDVNQNCGPLDGAVGFRGTVTQPDGSTRVVRFDAAGRRRTTADGNTHVSKNTPLPDDDLTAASYNLAGLSEGSESAMGLTQALKHSADHRGLVIQVTDAAKQVTQQTWNSNDALNLHQVATRTSPLQLVSRFGYTASGRLNSIAQPGSAPTTLTYGDASQPGLPDTQTDPNLNTTRFAYAKPGYLTTTTNALKQITERTPDKLGRTTRLVDPAGFVTTTKYDEAGNVLKVTDPYGNYVENTYDAAGNLQTRRDKRGVVTTYTYDRLNRLTSTSVPMTDGSTVVTRYEYDALGRLIRVTNPNNHVSTTAYDPAGNPLARANDLGDATRYEYNADNQVTKVWDPVNRLTETAYDSAGRVHIVRTDAGDQQTYTYDEDGRVKTLTDALGRQTVYTYHPDTGRLWKVLDPLGNTTRAEYDQAGNVTEIWGPGLNKSGQPVRTQFNRYDALNRRVSSIDANDNEWRTDYDANGNVWRRTAPGGLVTTYGYDKLNRLTSVSLPDGQVISYTLDPNGNRLTMTDATGVTGYAYDNLNRLVQTKAQGKVIKYGYDAAGNRTTLTYPGNKVVTYGFDRAERLNTVTDWLGKTTTYTLNQAGQVTDVALGNGTRTAISYDDSARLKLLAHTDSGGATISSQDLTREANGNIKEMAATLPLLPSFESSTTDMTYDDANRLTTVNGANVIHDAAGRITALGNAAYAYDARDLLTSYNPVGGTAVSYTYNGAGHRISKTEGATTTRYVIDPNAELPNVLQETDGSGTVLRHYVWGYGLLEQIDAAGKARYYHHDITGHTLALTSAAGKVTDKYAYTPYGDTTSQGSTPNPFKFVGKYGVMDEGNGLHFMRARFYRSDIARFIGADKIEGGIGNTKALNKYSYVYGEADARVDPSGLTAEPSAAQLGLDPAANFLKSNAKNGISDTCIEERPHQPAFENPQESTKKIISNKHTEMFSLVNDVVGSAATSSLDGLSSGKSDLYVRLTGKGLVGKISFDSATSIEVSKPTGTAAVLNFAIQTAGVGYKVYEGSITGVEGRNEMLKLTFSTEAGLVVGYVSGAACMGAATLLTVGTGGAGVAAYLVCGATSGIISSVATSWVKDNLTKSITCDSDCYNHLDDPWID